MSSVFSRLRIFRIAVIGLAGGLGTACSLEATRMAGLTPPQPISVGGEVQTSALAAPKAVQRQDLTPLPAVPIGAPAAPAAPVAPATPVAPASAPAVQTASSAAPPPAPQIAAPAVTPASPTGPHIVAPGETLYALARRYQVSPLKIAEANGLAATAHVRIGQKITIPGVNIARMAEAVKTPKPEPAPTVQEPKPAPAPVVVAEDKPEQPVSPPSTAPAEKVTEVAVQPEKTVEPSLQPLAYSPPENAGPARLSTTSFRWPVRGRIISEFGSAGSGQRNDGINFAVPEGSPVKAAENGVVVYAGNELKGYGNLVLVRHEGDFVTAYAHASELLVKRGDTVRRGQIIAKVGQTGSVNAPQLHFEIRKGPKPVNPADYLSGV